VSGGTFQSKYNKITNSVSKLINNSANVKNFEDIRSVIADSKMFPSNSKEYLDHITDKVDTNDVMEVKQVFYYINKRQDNNGGGSDLNRQSGSQGYTNA